MAAWILLVCFSLSKRDSVGESLEVVKGEADGWMVKVRNIGRADITTGY